MESVAALRTPLHDWHASHDARMVDFGGWEMPVSYVSIIDEHHATRRRAGLFDICHMGRLRFDGPDAVGFLDRVLTNRVDNLKVGQIRYSLVLNTEGCTLDDVLVYRLADYHLLVVNASNRPKLVDWFKQQLRGFDARMTDLTGDWGMVACQGPRAIAIAQTMFTENLSELHYYYAAPGWPEQQSLVSRTGYTGEDGIEVIAPSGGIVALWQRLLEAGGDSIQPVGLGARDTLRLEAGMPLYGHELTEQLDPIQAGLAWAVKSDAKDFVGKAALMRRHPSRPVRVGLAIADKRIAREGFRVVHGGSDVGFISSGTFSPTLEASIAMGYVSPDVAAIGTKLEVVIRDRPVAATVVPLPFYRREVR